MTSQVAEHAIVTCKRFRYDMEGSYYGIGALARNVKISLKETKNIHSISCILRKIYFQNLE